MRICIEKATKKILFMSTAATAGTLTQNAVNIGYTAGDVEERVVDASGYAAALAEDPSWIAEQAEQQAAQDRIAKKLADIAATLPTWAEYRAEINAIIDALQAATTVAQLRNATVNLAQRYKKDARIIYWLARDAEN